MMGYRSSLCLANDDKTGMSTVANATGRCLCTLYSLKATDQLGNSALEGGPTASTEVWQVVQLDALAPERAKGSLFCRLPRCPAIYDPIQNSAC